MCGFGGNGGRGHHRGWDGGRGQSRKRLHQHLQPVTPRGAKRHRPFAEAGVAAIEFALTAPIFLILMFGIVVYGFYFGTCIALAHAASEGARGSVAGITAGERANFAEATVSAHFHRYRTLLSRSEESG